MYRIINGKKIKIVKTYKNVEENPLTSLKSIKYKTYISGYPLQSDDTLGAMTLLYAYSHDDEVVSQYTACEGALKVLKEKYDRGARNYWKN